MSTDMAVATPETTRADLEVKLGVKLVSGTQRIFPSLSLCAA